LAALAITGIMLISQDALAPFTPSFEASQNVSPLPAPGTSGKSFASRRNKREDKPAEDSDNINRSRSQTAPACADVSMQSDGKYENSSSVTSVRLPLVLFESYKEDEEGPQ
jgi:hypothetical protein